MVGPKRSGKGTIARSVCAMIGPQNCAGPTASSLATNFGLQPLLGKQLAIISDARLSGGRADQDVIVERLLAISGQDSITVDRKNKEPVDVQLPTRFMILTNELPRFGDASGAIASRFLLLHTPNSWFGNEDTELTDKLLTELPGILLWAIKGWQQLRERGHFDQPESGRQHLETVADLSSPVAVFVRERCELKLGIEVAKADLYESYIAWCESGGVRQPPQASTFGRDLLAACPLVRAARPREGEKRTNAYLNIDLTADSKAEVATRRAEAEARKARKEAHL